MRSLLSVATLGLTALAYPVRYSANVANVAAGTYIGMGQSATASNNGECSITHNIPSAGFTEGTSYTFTISSSSARGLVWRVGSSQSNSNRGSLSSKQVTWTATGESVTAAALCGTQSSMYVAGKVTVNKAAVCSCNTGEFCPQGTTDCSSCQPVDNAATVSCTTNANSVATSCGQGFFVSNGQCEGCQACSSGEYANGGCMGSTNTVCSDCKTSCQQDFFLSAACTAGSSDDRTCNACSTSCNANQYRSVRCPGTGLSDTSECSNCKNCEADQFRANLCDGSGTVDSTTCSACTTSCTAGQWLSTPCNGQGTSNTATCEACTPVSRGVGVTCSSASNSVVASCEAGWYPNADNSACVECAAVTGAVSAVTCTSGSDSQVTDCGAGNYINESGDADVCTACREDCADGQFIQGGCSGTTNVDETSCVSCSTDACPQGEARNGECDGTGTSDPVCSACVAACENGQFRESTCTGGYTCGNCTTDCGQGKFLVAATCDGTGTVDSTCQDCTDSCTAGFGLSGPACTGTGSSDTRECVACVAASTFSTDGQTCMDCGSCEAGYAVTTNCTTTSDVECEDIDECATNASNCDQNATCANTVPGFTCTCNEGFTGSGTTCTANEAPTPSPSPTTPTPSPSGPTPTPSPTPGPSPVPVETQWKIEIVATFANVTEGDLTYIEQDVATAFNQSADQVTAEIISTRRRRDGDVQVKITITVADEDAAETLEQNARTTQLEFTTLLAENPSASLIGSPQITVVDPASSSARNLVPTFLIAAFAFALTH